MIPLLIVSNDDKLINDYINKLKHDSFFSEVAPSTKEYSIEDIKSLIKETKVFHPKTRIYFLANFHLSSIPAQNSFLKLLEEPPSNVQFVLTTDNKNNLLPTIVSRTKIVKLQIHKNNKITKNPIVDIICRDVINHVSTGIPLSKLTTTDKESAKKILLQLINFFRDKLDSDKKSPIILKEILKLNKLLDSNNLNPQLTVDQVLIFVWKQYKIKL